MRLAPVAVVLLSLVPCCRFPAYTVNRDDGSAGAPPAKGGDGTGATGAAGAGAAGATTTMGGAGATGGGGMAGAGAKGGAAGSDVIGSSGAGGEPPEPDTVECQGAKDSLVHHYDFEGTGTAVKDRVGTADGVIARNATLSKLDGKGVVLLGGGDTGAYVDLPNGLISKLTNATLEAWVTWGGGPANQRIFDFGDITDPDENKQGTGKSYLFLSPEQHDGSIETTFSSNGTNSLDHVSVEPGPALSQSLSQVVVVADSDANQLRLYVNGSKVGEQPWTAELSAIRDINVWLGRSQWGNDPELNAVFHDFRIYDAALSDAQIASCFVAGTDPSFLLP